MTPARQPEPQPNPDMNYSALERLDIKFTELIGAIEEKQVDGQLSSKDHGDYELVCYCRGFIRAELEKERRATHTSTPNPCEEQGCTDTENCDEICQYQRIYSQDEMDKARKAEREQVLKLVWVEVQSCGVSKEVFEGISLNVRAKSLRAQEPHNISGEV